MNIAFHADLSTYDPNGRPVLSVSIDGLLATANQMDCLLKVLNNNNYVKEVLSIAMDKPEECG